MTRMLASVTTLEDAEIALLGGADVIDVMADAEPNGTALDRIRAVVAAIGGRRLVSASVAGSPMPSGRLAETVQHIAATGVDTIKVHLPDGGTASSIVLDLADLASRVNLIAVFFADASPDLSLLSLLGRSGFTGAFMDTAPNSADHLLNHFDMPSLAGFVESCHAVGLLAGLAGALETPDVPRLLVLAPDLLGFKEALRDRVVATEAVSLTLVRAVRGLIPQERPVAGPPDVDYRLLAARGIAPAPGEDVPVDLVLVEDFVLPVFIGAYARERDAPQNVRFAVTASVARTGRAAEDMRDVFSYDLITDGIRLLVGSGHVALVETLAERIAAMVLGHPRVTQVVVRVQKLETGAGTVGVEIQRTRMAARPMDRPVVPLLIDSQKGVSGGGMKS